MPSFEDLYGSSFIWGEGSTGGDFTGVDEFSDMPSTPTDWLDFFESGSIPGIPGTPSDVSTEFEGTQTSDWEGGVWGQGGLGGFDYQNFTGEDIAGMIGDMGFGEGTEISQNFAEGFADAFNFATWGDPTVGGSPAAQMAALTQQYAMGEANLWESYDLWVDQQYDLLDMQYSNMYDEYTSSLEDLQDSTTQSLKDLLTARREQEISLTGEMTSATRAAGRSGFGTTGRALTSMSKAEDILSASTRGAIDILESSATAESNLLTGLESEAEMIWLQFTQGLETQQTALEHGMETLASEFETTASGIYFDWLDDLVEITGNIQGANPNWGDSFNPFVSEEGDDQTGGNCGTPIPCDEGYTWNDSTCTCECRSTECCPEGQQWHPGVQECRTPGGGSGSSWTVEPLDGEDDSIVDLGSGGGNDFNPGN